jgi:peptidoglycan/LPS O-acetylase OafA/YrhL
MRQTATRHRSRRIAALMLFEALTVVVMSTLHLSGAIHGGKKPYDPTGAGIAEAIIAIVLVGGAIALIRIPRQARAPALAAVGFAIAGFILGLTFTVRGGTALDVIYHATMLPALIATAVLLARGPRAQATRGPRSRPHAADQRDVGDATLDRTLPHV